jgi:hypothetical protein
MNSDQRRVKAIELTLTPEQVVFVWLRNAVQAGTFEEGARHSPPYRGMVADAVYETVRNSMKGHPELLIERAILQARREADLLYQAHRQCTPSRPRKRRTEPARVFPFMRIFECGAERKNHKRAN